MHESMLSVAQRILSAENVRDALHLVSLSLFVAEARALFSIPRDGHNTPKALAARCQPQPTKHPHL